MCFKYREAIEIIVLIKDHALQLQQIENSWNTVLFPLRCSVSVSASYRNAQDVSAHSDICKCKRLPVRMHRHCRPERVSQILQLYSLHRRNYLRCRDSPSRDGFKLSLWQNIKPYRHSSGQPALCLSVSLSFLSVSLSCGTGCIW